MSAGGGGSVDTPPGKPSSSTTSAARDKRYSHDSGLSDGSYVRRRTHRRVVGEHTSKRAYRSRDRESDLPRTTSVASMHSFRAACTRALREQQEQIARVAQLCEQLSRGGAKGTKGGVGAGGGAGGGGGGGRRPSGSASQDSSDISSSSRSRSTRDRGRKDKHRSNECKTYKIIMTKLDELNRLFATRGSPPPVRSPPPAVPRRRPLSRARSPRPSSSTSVSVSDKFVATDTPPRSQTTRPAQRQHSNRITAAYTLTADNRAGGGSMAPAPQALQRTPQLMERGAGGANFTEGGAGRAALARLAAARAHDLDIAPSPPHRQHTPRQALPKLSGLLNVATESVMQCESIDGSVLSGAAPICQFDLDDPLHLYAQVKRMQQLNASTPRRRTHSADNSRPTVNTARQPTLEGDKSQMHNHAHGASLCSLCRGYWRALTTLATQLLGRQEAEAHF